MIYDDLFRQILLSMTAFVFIAFAVWALVSPISLAEKLGYKLIAPNGYSEFYAIYIGVFLAQAVLCALAAYRVQDAIFGDIVALFLLAQPVGRFIALPRHKLPHGLLLILFMLEAASGAILLLVRPLA